MYVVHHLLSVVEGGVKPANQAALMATGVMPRWKEYLPKFKCILDDAELYAFDRSALIPAGDIRINNNRGLIDITELVTRATRRLFLEGDMRQMSEAMPDFLPAIPGDTELKKDPKLWQNFAVRRGSLMEIAGDGKCIIQSVTLLRTGAPRARLRKQGLNSEQARFINDFMRISLSVIVADIDMTLEPDISFQEFVAKLDPGFSKQEIDKTWLNEQMKRCFTARVDHSMPVIVEMSLSQDPFEVWKTELDGIFLIAFAMAAVLELKDTEQTARAVVLPRRDARGAPRKLISARASDMSSGKRTISVVTMRLHQDFLISPQKKAALGDRLSQKRSGSPRSLHHVRGHMFLARNGKIMYRKPHFRGRAGLRTLTRVVG
ncbi:hypothetical protein [Tateyamaria sp.]|uniref:hypothetical protein n=1 Tax=Tateyamaria sp. TaxID=1929288 RepID=UPI00329D4682